MYTTKGAAFDFQIIPNWESAFQGRKMANEQPDHPARNAIRSYFQSSEKRIFKTRELRQLISTMRAEWKAAHTVPFDAVVEYGGLKKVRLAFPGRPETRYCVGSVSVYEVALSLSPLSYLSHHTALFLNKLIEREPLEVFVNCEQSGKPRWEANLEQESIDWAFEQKPRMTNNIAQYEDRRIYLLSGKQTGGLGVASKAAPDSLLVQTTGVERTLVDAVVRPIYCGGMGVVQAAFRKAKGKLSVDLLAKVLQELDYLYPYHQSIGFLLDRAGVFRGSEIEVFLKMPREFDFYLEHQMDAPKYSERWRLYYPSALDALS